MLSSILLKMQFLAADVIIGPTGQTCRADNDIIRPTAFILRAIWVFRRPPK